MLSNRVIAMTLLLMFFVAPAPAQDKVGEPTNEKAQKTYKGAMQLLQEHQAVGALGEFKKADKQDDGKCLACQRKMIKYGVELEDWKTAELGAQEMVAEAQGTRDTALAHYELAVLFATEGMRKHKDEFYTRAHDEAAKALAAAPNFPDAIFLDGRMLALLQQDDAAKARFEQYAKMKPADDPVRQRALRYVSHPELARARLAPAFAVTTLDGQHISMDDLQGKVVLLDFWATWCGPCREALPHLRDVAKKFQGQPLVVLSVSLDADEQKWKEFIAKNEMSWPQYRDGGFTSPISKLFNVTAIPHTFTIDADGVLQDEHIGDGSIEGKLKKLLAQARELQTAQAAQSSQAAGKPETAAK
ncbi:MAG: TlpA disulfide reductase family protein [Candidatus Acidiferrales bacterium]